MEFSVLRPWMFAFFIPAALFCFFRLKSVQAWIGIVDAHLLDPLLVKAYVRLKERLSALFLILCVLSVLGALAGVSIKRGQTDLYHPKSPAVIVLDMSLSMKVKDVHPNRFSRAVFKIYDLLAELKGIPVSLIVFTDEPYQLVPATADKSVIENVLPLLNFSLMPSQGSRTDRAVTEALKAIKETGADFGDIFLITDGAEDVWELQDKTEALVHSAAQKGNRLFILGVGTVQGGQLFEKEDIPVLDALGNPVIHALKEGYLKHLAKQGGGAYAKVQMDGSDIDLLMKSRRLKLIAGEKSVLTDKSLNDKGYWFLILPLIGFPFLFQKGRLLIVLLTFWSFVPARADTLEHFLSPSGAAMRLLEQGNQDGAIKTALQSNDFTALYNVGTKLISLENYAQAIELLEKAVQLRPSDENAQINLEIARRLNENPNNDQTSNSGENDQTQNQDQSGAKEGNEEGENNLNQSNNNNLQDNDKKENSSGDGEGNTDGRNENSNDENSSEPNNQEAENQNDNDKAEASNENNSSSNSDGNGQSSGAGSGKEDNEPFGNGEGNGDSGDSGDSENETNASGEEEAGDSDENNASGGQNNENRMLPVHEDPLTLLRHKILFLYKEKRYNEEKQIGAQW